VSSLGGDPRQLLDPKTLVKLQRLDLIARSVVEGFVTGLHKSPFHGFSVEFAEHREYAPGDDIKHLDWKVFGRTDRYYIKEYEEETNLGAYVVVDASESMTYKSDAAPCSKLQYAKMAGAALLYLILNQRDSVGLVTFDKDVREFIAPSAHASHLKILLNQLQKTEAKGETSLGDIFHSLAERIRRKGLVIVISDLLDDPEKVLFGLKHLRHRKHEVILLHVMDKTELTFQFDTMLKLEGLESAREEMVDPISIRKSYLEELKKYLEAIRKGCRTNKVDYVLMDTSQPLDVALTGYLATRGSMKLK
jgi:uncharacterized protein (DUF58 family)